MAARRVSITFCLPKHGHDVIYTALLGINKEALAAALE